MNSSVKCLESLPASASLSTQNTSNLVGIVKELNHPVLGRRALVLWNDRGQNHEDWLPILKNISVTVGDQVMITQVANRRDSIVTGVIDGWSDDIDCRNVEAGVFKLELDQSLTIVNFDDTPLLRVQTTSEGPVIKVLVKADKLDLPGEFRLVADSVHIEARKGEMDLVASGDVKIRGEIIRAN